MREIPVVVLSAKSEETDQVVGFSLGCDDYVTKPFSVKVLLQRIKALQRARRVGPSRWMWSNTSRFASTACAIEPMWKAANWT